MTSLLLPDRPATIDFCFKLQFYFKRFETVEEAVQEPSAQSFSLKFVQNPWRHNRRRTAKSVDELLSRERLALSGTVMEIAIGECL